MSKTEVLDELPKLTKTERQEILLKLAELDSEDWLDDEELTAHYKALIEARLAAYAEDPDAGSTWEEAERRIRAVLVTSRTMNWRLNRHGRSGALIIDGACGLARGAWPRI